VAAVTNVAPIAVLSFNRPHYLEPVLASLASQKGIEERAIHFFQDGAVNRHSGKRWAEDAEIETCIALCRRFFPWGVMHISADNIGICENFRRAEKFVFEELDAEVAYFFEDDMVVSANYVETLDGLQAQIATVDSIGYFAAYGLHRLSSAEQAARRRDLVQLEHIWAFGLKREHWRDMQRILAPYYAIVCESDYRDRPHGAIRRFYASLGVPSVHTSQDTAKAIATILLGRWRCNTIPALGRYIGETGVHFRPAYYAEQGYAATEVFAEKLEGFIVPEERELNDLVRSYGETFRKKHAAYLAQLPPDEQTPVAMRSILQRLWGRFHRPT
jgi:hypothetical protein